MKDKTHKFLRRLDKDDLSTEVDQAIEFWESLKELCDYYDSDNNPPTIGVDTVGNIHFSWQFETLYVECEIFQNKDPEAFYEYLLIDEDVNAYEEGLTKVKDFSSIKKLSFWMKKFLDGSFV